MKSLTELQPLIVDWAKDKNIHLAECIPQQRLKLIEECGELSSAILKGNHSLQKDAIGDIFVVLIILSKQSNLEVIFDFRDYESENINVWVHISNIIRYGGDIKQNLLMLNDLSSALNFDLTECANIAWKEIKDRKGKTENGTFIKN